MPHENEHANDNATQLDEAVARVYDAFHGYQFPKPEPAIKNARKALDALASSRLRDHTAEELNEFIHTAHFATKDPSALKYFLPRILELCVIQGSLPFDIELVAARLAAADWTHWPAEERGAVAEFLFAVWSGVLSARSEMFEEMLFTADTWLCALGVAAGNISHFLDQWAERILEPTARLHLAAFVIINVEALVDDAPLFSAYWEEDAQAQALSWLKSRNLLEALALPHQTGLADGERTRLREAHDLLGAYQA
jgi:hypothetical protein